MEPNRNGAQPLAFGASTFAVRIFGNNSVTAMIARMGAVRTFYEQSNRSFSHTIRAAKNQFLKLRHAQTYPVLLLGAYLEASARKRHGFLGFA